MSVHTIYRTTVIAFILSVAITNAVPPQAATARELAVKFCLDAKTEKDKLTAQGYGTFIDQGPQQIRSTMTPILLIGVKRLIYLTEVVKFRCDEKKLQALVKRLNSPAYRRWRSLKPPLPQRNPKFRALQRR